MNERVRRSIALAIFALLGLARGEPRILNVSPVQDRELSRESYFYLETSEGTVQVIVRDADDRTNRNDPEGRSDEGGAFHSQASPSA